MKRTKCTVEKVAVSPLIVKGSEPYELLAFARIVVWLTRTYTDGRNEQALLELELHPKYKTDGASTFWPISLLVPQWKELDDQYNAAPVAHDVLYMLAGIVEGEHEPVKLIREEVDDILRGMWRCWGMSRFLAGCADKGVEICAGGKRHWGSDTYKVREFVNAKWSVLQ